MPSIPSGVAVAGRRDEDVRLEARSAETVLCYAHLDSEEASTALGGVRGAATPRRRVDELAVDGLRDEESWIGVKSKVLYLVLWSGTLRQPCACACFVYK